MSSAASLLDGSDFDAHLDELDRDLPRALITSTTDDRTYFMPKGAASPASGTFASRKTAAIPYPGFMLLMMAVGAMAALFVFHHDAVGLLF